MHRTIGYLPPTLYTAASESAALPSHPAPFRGLGGNVEAAFRPSVDNLRDFTYRPAMASWIERHRADRVARGLPAAITNPSALTVLASVIRASNERTVGTVATHNEQPED